MSGRYYAVGCAALRSPEIGIRVAVLRLDPDDDLEQACREIAEILYPPEDGWDSHYTTHYSIAEAIIDLEKTRAIDL